MDNKNIKGEDINAVEKLAIIVTAENQPATLISVFDMAIFQAPPNPNPKCILSTYMRKVSLHVPVAGGSKTTYNQLFLSLLRYYSCTCCLLLSCFSSDATQTGYLILVAIVSKDTKPMLVYMKTRMDNLFGFFVLLSLNFLYAVAQHRVVAINIEIGYICDGGCS
jgi:hypothetical protein